jgi:anti-sigma factor (TIGR02949 family)
MDRPLDCEDVIARLFEYLDRELDAATVAAIDEHMKKCRGCFSRAEFERRLKVRLAEAGEVEAPTSLRLRARKLLQRF